MSQRRLLPMVVIAGLGLGLAGLGCTSVAVPRQPSIPTPAQPNWEPAALLEHLRFFNQVEVNGRATGTVGYATAASYVAARMEEFGLQPVLGSSFRVVYQTSLNYPLGAFISVAGAADTLAFWAGIDFMPDGRSDSGHVEISTLVMDPGKRVEAVAGERAVMLRAEQATTAYLRALARQGTRAVLIVGGLEPRQSAAPIDRLVAVRVLPETAARILAIASGRMEALLNGAQPQRRRLQQTLQVHVIADHQPMAGAINVIGFQAGKHPRLASELVIVCADLDAIGSVGTVEVFDTRHLGTGAAAVLEVARVYGAFARYWPLPERSILFAVWSGARIGQAGLKAYLRHPPWLLEQTRAVIYAGLAPEDEPAVRDLLEAHGLPLYMVPQPQWAEETQSVSLRPSAEVRRQARKMADRAPADAMDRSRLLESAVSAAQVLADSINVLLLREAISPGPYVPVQENRLRVPTEPPPGEQ